MASMVDELRRQDMLKRAGAEMYSTPTMLSSANRTAAPKPAAPQASGPSLIQRALPNTYAATKMAGEDIGAAYKQGGGGAAVGQAIRSSLTPSFGLIDDIGQKAAGVLQAPAQALKTLVTGDASPIGSEPAAVSNPLVRAATAPKTMTPQSMEKAVPSDPVRRPLVQAAQQAPAAPAATEVRPGIFRQGNSFSDSAAGAADGAKSSQISAQNMSAADALAARYAPTQTAQPQAPMNQNITPQTSGSGYGLLDAGSRDRRNALMDVQQAKPGSGTALKSLLQQQADAPAQQLARDRLAQDGQNSAADRLVRSNELVARAGESAADRALKSQELADSMKTNAVKRDAAGMEMGAAKQLADLRTAYLNAKTPEEQKAAVDKINALSGKASTDEYMAVASGQTVDSMGNITKAPDLIVNKRTGQPVNVGQGAKPAQGPTQITNDAAGQSAFAALPSGAVFIGPDGKQHRKD